MGLIPDEDLGPDTGLEVPVEQAWAEEIARRIAAVDSGEELLLSWDEVKGRLFPEDNR